MAYRSTLEARISKRTTKAITDFNLIEDGDRIMVGLSGGKDSWALMQVLDNLRRRAPITFSLIAVTVDSGYKDFKHGVIARTCAQASSLIARRTVSVITSPGATAFARMPCFPQREATWRRSACSPLLAIA